MLWNGRILMPSTQLAVRYSNALTTVSAYLFTFLSDYARCDLTLNNFECNDTAPYIVINLAILGFGFALFSSPNTNAVMSSVENRFYGVASATVSTMRLIG
jgi:hypothetical protein